MIFFHYAEIRDFGDGEWELRRVRGDNRNESEQIHRYNEKRAIGNNYEQWSNKA